MKEITLDPQKEIEELIEDCLKKCPTINEIYKPPTPDSPFTILEDLKLLYSVRSYLKTREENLSNAFLSLLQENILDRTIEMIEARYDLLSKLDKHHFSVIFSNHLRHNGTQGYLILEKIEDEVRIKEILQDLNEANYSHNHGNNVKKIKKRIKIKRRDLCYKEENEIEQENNKENTYEISYKNPKSCELCYKYSKIIPLSKNTDNLPNLFEDENIFPENENEEKIIIKRDFQANRRNIREFEELDEDLMKLKEITDMLMKKYDKSSEEIIEICSKVSGKIPDDVVEYMESDEIKQKQLVWTEDDDEILKLASNKEDKKFKFLLKYKDIEKVKTRALFKGIMLPFEF